MLSSFSSLESHTKFSMKLKDIEKNDEVKDLVEEWVKRFDSLGKVYPSNVSGTFNTLSKLRIFDEKWKRKYQEN